MDAETRDTWPAAQNRVSTGEFMLLYVGLPLALLAARWVGCRCPCCRSSGSRPIPPRSAWCGATGGARKELVGFSMTRPQAGHLLLRVAIAAAALTGGILLVAPEQLFGYDEVPRCGRW